MLAIVLAAITAQIVAAPAPSRPATPAPPASGTSAPVGVPAAPGARGASATVAVPSEPEPFPLDPTAEKLSDQGYQLLSQGKHEEAIAPLRELVTLAPTNPRGHRLLGFALAGAGKNAEAEKELSQAVKLKVNLKRLPSARPGTHGGRRYLRSAQRRRLRPRPRARKPERARVVRPSLCAQR
jgi:cytochrome c-type biogenesis protein CcmH/NrfG